MNKETNSIETMKKKNINYTILRPGGNDTCLVKTEGLIPLSNERRKINNYIQNIYPNVEQVGFVNCQTLELMMAGGEFCGNATRSAAWLILDGKPGEILINVSGVKQKLKAGINSDGEAYTQMPVMPSTSSVIKNGNGYTVELEGITHFVDFSENATVGLSTDEVKLKAFQMLKNKDLDSIPASGVIFVNQRETSYCIEPVVYVRDINTLYYETACGSGTTALGLVLALKSRNSIKNIPIIQPSGMPIKVSVDFDGRSFGYTQIQGATELLMKGSARILEEIYE